LPGAFFAPFRLAPASGKEGKKMILPDEKFSQKLIREFGSFAIFTVLVAQRETTATLC